MEEKAEKSPSQAGVGDRGTTGQALANSGRAFPLLEQGPACFVFFFTSLGTEVSSPGHLLGSSLHKTYPHLTVVFLVDSIYRDPGCECRDRSAGSRHLPGAPLRGLKRGWDRCSGVRVLPPLGVDYAEHSILKSMSTWNLGMWPDWETAHLSSRAPPPIPCYCHLCKKREAAT